MGLYRAIVRPVLFRLGPEWCHDRALGVVRVMGGFMGRGGEDPILETAIGTVKVANPVGLAAGFDKSGVAVRGLVRLGFGHVEVGSVSAFPSRGNARPRLWRLPADRGILVHYGLPNDGAEVVASRLAMVTRDGMVVGVNVVATNRGEGVGVSDEEVVGDYVASVRALRGVADYFVLNLSCPNTDQGRNFFACRGNLGRLLVALGEVGFAGRPVFLKVGATIDARGVEELLGDVESFPWVSGFSFNLPAGVREGLRTPRRVWEGRAGAVSGKPVEKVVNAAISEMWGRMDRRRYQIIGAGGVFSAEDAHEKIRLGASVVQVLTALVYEGPGVVGRINRGLAGLLRRDGFRSVAEAVGTAHGG